MANQVIFHLSHFFSSYCAHTLLSWPSPGYLSFCRTIPLPVEKAQWPPDSAVKTGGDCQAVETMEANPVCEELLVIVSNAVFYIQHAECCHPSDPFPEVRVYD